MTWAFFQGQLSGVNMYSTVFESYLSLHGLHLQTHGLRCGCWKGVGLKNRNTFDWNPHTMSVMTTSSLSPINICHLSLTPGRPVLQGREGAETTSEVRRGMHPSFYDNTGKKHGGPTSLVCYSRWRRTSCSFSCCFTSTRRPSSRWWWSAQWPLSQWPLSQWPLTQWTLSQLTPVPVSWTTR